MSFKAQEIVKLTIYLAPMFNHFWGRRVIKEAGSSANICVICVKYGHMPLLWFILVVYIRPLSVWLWLFVNLFSIAW